MRLNELVQMLVGIVMFIAGIILAASLPSAATGPETIAGSLGAIGMYKAATHGWDLFKSLRDEEMEERDV